MKIRILSRVLLRREQSWNPGSDLCPHLLAFKVAPCKKDNSREMSPFCPEIQYPNAVQVTPACAEIYSHCPQLRPEFKQNLYLEGKKKVLRSHKTVHKKWPF